MEHRSIMEDLSSALKYCVSMPRMSPDNVLVYASILIVGGMIPASIVPLHTLPKKSFSQLSKSLLSCSTRCLASEEFPVTALEYATATSRSSILRRMYSANAFADALADMLKKQGTPLKDSNRDTLANLLAHMGD